MNKPLAGLLLLDDTSRVGLKINIADIAMSGITIISSLHEITDRLLEDSRNIIVLGESFRTASFSSDLRLYKSVWDLEVHILTTDPTLTHLVSSIGKVYSIDYRVLDYSHIFGILTGDTVALREIPQDTNPEIVRLAESLVREQGSSLSVKRVAEAYLSSRQLVEEMKVQYQELNALYEEQKSLADSLSARVDQLTESQLDMIRSYMEVNKFLTEYGIITSRDIYEKVILSRYPSRPRIIYLKVYEELIHMESFLLTLMNVFTFQQRLNTQIVRLFDSDSSIRYVTLPSYYKKVKNKFTKSDVLGEQFLAKVGGYKEMLQLILTNPTRLDLLIVVDQKATSDTILTGNCLQLGVCRNPNHISVLGLDPNITVVNNTPDLELSWDTYAEYPTLSQDDLFLFLSSRPIIQRIIELEQIYNEGWNQHE